VVVGSAAQVRVHAAGNSVEIQNDPSKKHFVVALRPPTLYVTLYGKFDVILNEITIITRNTLALDAVMIIPYHPICIQPGCRKYASCNPRSAMPYLPNNSAPGKSMGTRGGEPSLQNAG